MHKLCCLIHAGIVLMNYWSMHSGKFQYFLPISEFNSRGVCGSLKMIRFKFVFFCRTEFHVKFLWGSKGAMIPPNERYTKFDDILTLMAKRYCSETDQTINGNAQIA